VLISVTCDNVRLSEDCCEGVKWENSGLFGFGVVIGVVMFVEKDDTVFESVCLR
jgi:hypothetical protein